MGILSWFFGHCQRRHFSIQTCKNVDILLNWRLWDLLIVHHRFWQAPLGVCSTKRRHQSPEWTILSHVSCFIQGEVIGFQVLLDSLGDLLQLSKGEAVKIFLASASLPRCTTKNKWTAQKKLKQWGENLLQRLTTALKNTTETTGR